MRGCPRRLTTRQARRMMTRRGLMVIEGIRNKKDTTIRGKNIDTSTVGITSRMVRIGSATYVVRECQVKGPRNTASATSPSALLLLKNSDLELRKDNGLGLVQPVRLLFRLPRLSHPTIPRRMNRNRSHYAWQHLGYPLLRSHRYRRKAT